MERFPDVVQGGPPCLLHLIMFVFNFGIGTDRMSDFNNQDSTQCNHQHQDVDILETFLEAFMLQTSSTRSFDRTRTTGKEENPPESPKNHDSEAGNIEEAVVESAQLGQAKSRTFKLSRIIDRNISSTYIPFVKSITKVKGDGHSAFWAIVVGIGKCVDDWSKIEDNLIGEIQSRPNFYTQNFIKKSTELEGVNEFSEALGIGKQKPLSPFKVVYRLHMSCGRRGVNLAPKYAPGAGAYGRVLSLLNWVVRAP